MNGIKLFLHLDGASDDSMVPPLSDHYVLQIFRPLFLLQNKKKFFVKDKVQVKILINFKDVILVRDALGWAIHLNEAFNRWMEY